MRAARLNVDTAASRRARPPPERAALRGAGATRASVRGARACAPRASRCRSGDVAARARSAAHMQRDGPVVPVGPEAGVERPLRRADGAAVCVRACGPSAASRSLPRHAPTTRAHLRGDRRVLRQSATKSSARRGGGREHKTAGAARRHGTSGCNDRPPRTMRRRRATARSSLPRAAGHKARTPSHER